MVPIFKDALMLKWTFYFSLVAKFIDPNGGNKFDSGIGFLYHCVLETNKQYFWFEPKQTERSVLLFRETKKQNISVCFGVSNLYRNNRNKQNCFKTNRNKPGNPKIFCKNTKICSLSNCFSWSSLCFGSIENRNSLFRYRTETNCFETNQNKPKQT